MEVKEADFQKIVISIAKASGWLVHHPLPSMNRRGIWATHELGDHGFPDLVLAHPKGRVIFAELKSDKGKVSPLQSRWLSVLRTGAVVKVWRPADLDWIASYAKPLINNFISLKAYTPRKVKGIKHGDVGRSTRPETCNTK
jgi:hypothetical protein